MEVEKGEESGIRENRRRCRGGGGGRGIEEGENGWGEGVDGSLL